MTTLDQRILAAQLGTSTRQAKAEDRRAIRHGQLRVSDLLENPTGHWHTTLLYELLLSARGFGRGHLRVFNATAIRAGVNVCRPIGEVPPLQRAFVIRYLRDRGL